MLVVPISASARPLHHPQPRPGCNQLFTVHHGMKRAQVIFAGTRVVSMRDFKELGYIERCMRIPKAKHFMRWYDHHERALHLARVEAAEDKAANTPAPMNSLVHCVVWAESTDNYQAVNGNHEGLGQWDHATWIADGGGRFAYSPLGATYNQQLIIIEDVVAGRVPGENATQWTNYDPC